MTRQAPSAAGSPGPLTGRVGAPYAGRVANNSKNGAASARHRAVPRFSDLSRLVPTLTLHTSIAWTSHRCTMMVVEVTGYSMWYPKTPH